MDPRRTAIGLLWELGGEEAIARVPVSWFTAREQKLLAAMLRRGVNCPRTSAVGRLFDAVAALTGLQTTASFEGQAAMAVEFAAASEAARSPGPVQPFSIPVTPAGNGAQVLRVIDWGPAFGAILDDVEGKAAAIALRFHETLVSAALAVIEPEAGKRIVGCFQNRLLSERLSAALGERGGEVYWHRRVPPNDGGLAVGQAGIALAVESRG
jgi:hydrogenase maturation protein HypF